jgi:hypothetical protein
MRLPNKITTFNESVLSKLAPVLRVLENGDIPIMALYERVRAEVEDVDVFLTTLDCLYALGKISLNEEERTISYVSDVS